VSCDKLSDNDMFQFRLDTKFKMTAFCKLIMTMFVVLVGSILYHSLHVNSEASILFENWGCSVS